MWIFFDKYVLLYYMIHGSLIHGYRTVYMGKPYSKVISGFLTAQRVKVLGPSTVQGSAVLEDITTGEGSVQGACDRWALFL